MTETKTKPATTTLPDTISNIANLDSAAIADSIPIPTLESAPVTSQLKSHLLLLTLLASSILAAYTYGFELLQVSDHTTWAEMGITLFLLLVFGGGAAWLIGVHKIDWWELVWGYWWFSMPIAGAAGVVLVRLMEGSEGIEVKD